MKIAAAAEERLAHRFHGSGDFFLVLSPVGGYNYVVV